MAPEPQQQQAESGSTGRFGRLFAPIGRVLAWAKGSRLKAAMLGVACIISLGAVGGMAIVWLHSSSDEEATLEMALAAFDNTNYVRAKELAELLRISRDVPPEAMGGPAFVAGASWSYEADESWITDEEKQDYYLISVKYLEEARDLGFPPGYEGEGLFLLGRNLYLTGQIPFSRPVLQEAIKRNPRKKVEAQWLLASAYLNDANPKYEQALRENTVYLASPRLLPDDKFRGLVQRARILLRLDRLAECREALDQIPSDAKQRADALVVRGQSWLWEARKLRAAADSEAETPEDVNTEDANLAATFVAEAEAQAEADTAIEAGDNNQARAERMFEKALGMFREAQGHDTLTIQAGRKAMYLTGVCLHELGRDHEGLEEFARLRKLFPDTPEAMAADFQTAELLRGMRDPDSDRQALAAYRRALRTVQSARNYSNPWIPLDEIRERSLGAYRDFIRQQKYDRALRLTESLYPVFTPAQATELAAQAHRDWGLALLEQAAAAPVAESPSVVQEGRRQLRFAGDAYAKLAAIRITTHAYRDDLWTSSENYLQGHGYSRAATVLREYLKNESQKRNALALLRLGEALLNLGQLDQSLTALEECIEFHQQDPAAYQARLAAANAYIEKGEADKAVALLEDNLIGELGPDSREFRQSLFALGYLLEKENHYQEAILRLREAVNRYEEQDPQAVVEALYLMGRCYAKAAENAKAKLKEELLANRRTARQQEIVENLEAALQQYVRAQELLNRRLEISELTELEKKTLRNCYFAIGATLFEQEKYAEAIKVYRTATSHYQNAPASLDAYVQIARAWRRLGDPQQARDAIEQAKTSRARLESVDAPQQATNFTTEEWKTLLDWIETL